VSKFEKHLQALQGTNPPPATRETALGPIAIIKFSDLHINFIFNSWLKSYKDSATVKFVSPNIYYDGQHKVIEKLLKTAKTLVAVDAQDPQHILGYLNYEVVDNVFVLHFGYVKQKFRNTGVLKALVAEAGHITGTAGCYTHDTKSCSAIMPKFNLVFHPYLLINRDA